VNYDRKKFYNIATWLATEFADAVPTRCIDAGDVSRLLFAFVPDLSNVVTGVPPAEPTETIVCRQFSKIFCHSKLYFLSGRATEAQR
jgi:hypothetical protein